MVRQEDICSLVGEDQRATVPRSVPEGGQGVVIGERVSSRSDPDCPRIQGRHAVGPYKRPGGHTRRRATLVLAYECKGVAAEGELTHDHTHVPDRGDSR